MTNRTAQLVEVSTAGAAPPAGAGIQIRIGKAEIRIDGNSDLTLLRDVLRVVTEIC